MAYMWRKALAEDEMGKYMRWRKEWQKMTCTHMANKNSGHGII